MGDAAKLREALLSAAEYGGEFNSLRYWLTRAGQAIQTAPPQPERDVPNLDCWHCPPQPEPEAKAKPDYTCPKCGKDFRRAEECACPPVYVVSTANARIAELVRERDEAREGLLKSEADRYLDFRKGVAAAKEACAKAVEAKADAENPFWFSVANMVARTIRETEVPDA